MRVICIENSWSHDPKSILVHKDSIYNVIQIHTLPHLCIRGSILHYQLLETGKSIHSSTIFREIDDISELVEEFEEAIPNQ